MAVVLIVDDEVDLCLAIAENFKFSGFETLVAHSGQEALTVLSKTAVDVVVSDIKMPNGDGVMLMKGAKENGITSPFILITGHTEFEADNLKALGAEDVFTKPLQMETLIDAVKRAVPVSTKAS